MIRRQKERSALVRTLENALAALAFLLVWQGASMALDDRILLPSPIAVLLRFGELLTESEFYGAVSYSLLRIALGFLCGLLGGILLAALASLSHTAEVLLRPYMFTVKSVPVASFVVLALVWVTGARLSFFIAFLMVLPIVYTNLLEGLRSLPDSTREMADMYGISHAKRAVYLYVPHVKAHLFAACRVSLGLAWKAGIAAEMIGIPDGSIGEALYLYGSQWWDTTTMLAYTLTVVLLSLLFEHLVMALLRLFYRLWYKL